MSRPWDRNHAEYGREGYVKDYHEQIREVLTNYGPVFEIWFDGANGGDGWYGGARETRTIPNGYYRFPEAVEMIRKLQPDCVRLECRRRALGRLGERTSSSYPQWHTMDSARAGDIANGVPHGDLWVPAEGRHLDPARLVLARAGGLSASKLRTKLMNVWFDMCRSRREPHPQRAPGQPMGKSARPRSAPSCGSEDCATICSHGISPPARRRKVPPAATIRGFHPANLTDGDIESYWAADDGLNAPSAEISACRRVHLRCHPPARADSPRPANRLI